MRSPTAGFRSCLIPRGPSCCSSRCTAGSPSRGRDASALDIAAVVPLAIHDDLEVARNLVRPWLAFYLGAMGAKDKNFYVELAASYGHGDAARAVQTAFLEGDRMGAALAITDELIDSAAIATTPEGLPERLAAYEAAGVTTLVAVPSGDDKAAVVRALAEAGVHA